MATSVVAMAIVLALGLYFVVVMNMSHDSINNDCCVC
jgi:hypothetical protein